MLSKFINLVHIVLALFIILAPFIGNEYFLTLHVILLPFIVFHWITNQSVCALTEIEKLVSGKKVDDETFFGKLVGPVYKFRTQEDEMLFLYGLMGCLFTITFIKLRELGFVQLRADWARFLELFTRLPESPPTQSYLRVPIQNPSPSQPPRASPLDAPLPSWE